MRALICGLAMAIKVYYLSITVNSRSQHSGSSTIVIFFYSSGNTVFNTTLNVIFYEGRIFKEGIKIESCTAGRPKTDRIGSYFNYTRPDRGCCKISKLHHLRLYHRFLFGTLYDGSSSISSLLGCRVQALYKSIMDEMPGKSVMSTCHLKNSWSEKCQFSPRLKNDKLRPYTQSTASEP